MASNNDGNKRKAPAGAGAKSSGDVLSEFETDRPLAALSAEFLAAQHASRPSNWAMIMTHSEIQACVRYVAWELNQRFADCKEGVVLTGILKGAYIFVSDLTKNLTIPYSVYFLEASSYSDGQVQSDEVQLLSRLVPSKFVGRKVVLLDELFDHGQTMHSIRRHLLQTKELKLTEADIFCCTLFSKDSGTSATPPDVVGMTKLPNVWLVGYGLDDQGEKRGWGHLYVCPKIPGIETVPADAVLDADPGVAEAAMRVVRQCIVDQLEAMRAKCSYKSPPGIYN